MGKSMSEQEEEAIEDHLVIHYWLQGWGMVRDESKDRMVTTNEQRADKGGYPRQKAVRKDAPGFALGVQWHAEYDAQSNPVNHTLFEAFGAALAAYARSP